MSDRNVNEQMLLATPLLPATVSSLAASSSRILFDGRSTIPFGLSSEVPWLLSLDLMIWNALVLGFFGTAIARSVASSFCGELRTGILKSLRYAIGHVRDTLLATGLIVVFLGILHVMLRCADLVTRIGSVGQLAVSIIWGLVFCTSVALIFVLVVGGIAWLLSLSATGTDGCSGAEALSRSISYVLSHRLWSVCGVLAVTLIALAARFLFQAILIAGINALPAGVNNSDNDFIRRSWIFVIELIPHVAQLSVFLTGMTILYVLLRQKEDGISTEEIDGAV